MKRKPYSRRKRTTTKSVLRLPDLEHAKAAVLNSLTSLDAQRGYRHAIDEFVDWYCSEPRYALVALMQEKSIDKITVQEVLDRATVGRSTFYFHYRDKDDLFLCVLEDGLEMWSTALLRKQEKSYRIAPVAEFFGHIGDAKKLYRALVDSGRIHAFFELAQGYFARSIARHLKDMGLKDLVQSELDARSHALAGNLLSLLKWWLDRGARESPKAMDELFHRMAWNGLQSKSKLQ